MTHLGLSQEFFYRVNYLGVEQGLSFRHATSIVQDKQGFIWIGTQNGLNRYDGYEFMHYTSGGDNSLPKLSGNRINDLQLDAEGNLWIATSTGLDVLNPETNELRSFSLQDVFQEQLEIKGIDAISITTSSSRIFIHGHEQKAFNFLYNTVEFKDGSFHELSFSDSEQTINYKYIANVFEDKEQKLWVRPANTKTFFQLNSTYKVEQEIELPDSIGGYSLRHAISGQPGFTYGNFNPNIEFTQLKEGELKLMGTFCDSYNTFMVQGSLEDSFKVIFDSIGLEGRHMPVNYFIDQDQDALIDLDDNINIVNHQGIKKINTDLLNLKDDNVTDFYQSKDGTIWICTNFGIYRLIKEYNPFNFYLNKTENNKGFGRSTRAIVGDSNNLYVTVVHDGIWKVDRETRKGQQLVKQQIKQGEKTYDILPYSMYKQNEALWLCNWFNDGVLKLDLNTLSIAHIRGKEEIGGFGRSMVKGTGDTLWIGTDQGLFVLNIKTEDYTLYSTNSISDQLNKKDISALTYDSSLTLWVGTRSHGLYKVDNKKETHLIANKESGLNSNLILSICRTKDFLWVGTPAGLNRIDLKTRSIKQYGQRNGLPNNAVNSIAKRGRFLWLSTNEGLCKLDLKDETISSFFEEDGLIHEEFNYSSQLSLNDGTLLFGGMNGLVEIGKEVVQRNIEEQVIILTDFERSGAKSSEYQTLSSIRNKGIDIEPTDKSFQFKFSYLDLFSAKNLQYKYRLQAYDEDWTLNGTDNRVRFNQLPAGEYVFLVKALNRYGQWTENTLEIPIRVHQIFYKKAWFLLLCIGLIVSLFYLIYFLKVREIKRLGELRLQIASNLHDDVGSLLTQIGMQSELLQAKVYQGKEEEKELSKMTENSHAAISTMSDVVWSIDSRQDHLSDLLDRMKDYAIDLLSKKSIKLTFHQNEDMQDTQTLSPQFRQSVYLIFKEAINNVAKHSNATEVKVNIEAKRQSFKMLVSDNGSIDKSKNRLPGQGLKNMQMRADKMGAKLYLNQSDGFSVTLTTSKYS